MVAWLRRWSAERRRFRLHRHVCSFLGAAERWSHARRTKSMRAASQRAQPEHRRLDRAGRAARRRCARARAAPAAAAARAGLVSKPRSDAAAPNRAALVAAAIEQRGNRLGGGVADGAQHHPGHAGPAARSPRMPADSRSTTAGQRRAAVRHRAPIRRALPAPAPAAGASRPTVSAMRDAVTATPRRAPHARRGGVDQRSVGARGRRRPPRR